MQQHATVTWQGALKDGVGSISTESGSIENLIYSYGTRFEEKVGTNPEELIAAAHAACYSMALAGELEKSGNSPQNISTTCSVTFEKKSDEWSVSHSALSVIAYVPNIATEEFMKIAEHTKMTCPVSRLLKAEITLKAELQVQSQAA